MTLVIQQISMFRGPSVWSPAPVVAVDLGQGAGVAMLSPEEVTQMSWLLNEYRIEQGAGKSLPMLEAPDSADPIIWAGWLAIALQRLVAVPVERSFQRNNWFAFEVRHERIGNVAARLAIRAMNDRIWKSGPPFDGARELTRLANLNAAYDHGPVGRAFVAAAHARRIPVDQRGRIVEFGTGRYRTRRLGTTTSHTPSIAMIVARDKKQTNQFLAAAGFPVPDCRRARSARQAVECAELIGYPVVLKPIDLADSQLVFVDIRDRPEVAERYEAIRANLVEKTTHVLVEKFIAGNVYRALVVDNQVVAVFQRVIAHVIGDGARTIADLILAENARTERGTPELRPIVVDDETALVLGRQGLDLTSIPAPGRHVTLKPQIGHKRDGGLARDCTDELHPENAALLVHAATTIGLDVAGIDFVTSDLSQPLIATGGAIIEINGSPDFERHLRPSIGQPRDPTGAVLDMLFPLGSPVRAPIVAVTGSTGAAWIVRAIAASLTACGRTVGMAAGMDVEVAGMRLSSTSPSRYLGGRHVLFNHAVDTAVLETPADEVVALGLLFDHCDVAVITACSDASPAGFPSPESILCQTALPHGMLVLAGDDPAVVALGHDDASRILLYSVEPDSETIAAHRRNGGSAVVLQPGPSGIVAKLLQPDARECVLTNLPLDDVENASRMDWCGAIAATVAVAIVLDIPFDTMRSHLPGGRARVTNPAPGTDISR